MCSTKVFFFASKHFMEFERNFTGCNNKIPILKRLIDSTMNLFGWFNLKFLPEIQLATDNHIQDTDTHSSLELVNILDQKKNIYGTHQSHSRPTFNLIGLIEWNESKTV